MAMEGVSTFLESSTIHGLTYISTTRKYVRLLWILVVITGFVGASLIIKESFDSWSESPVKTTIETFPISDIRFPKVTVCPPKNTFTDLNYDLMIIANKTLTKEMRDEMFKNAVEGINEEIFSQKKWKTLYEEDRFYNWYHGYTLMNEPQLSNGQLNIFISTSTTSDVVTTPYFGEKFQPDLVKKKLFYYVSVYTPKIFQNNDNVTLHFKLETNLMKGLVKPSEDFVFGDGLGDFNAGQATTYANFTPPGETRDLMLSRNVKVEEVEALNSKLMPGLRFRWWYTGAKVSPDPKFKDEQTNKQLIR